MPGPGLAKFKNGGGIAGATGDLTCKKMFPALQAMIRRGHLDMPVVGVGRSKWTLDQFKTRAKDSLEQNGGLDPAAYAIVVDAEDGLLGEVDVQRAIRLLGRCKVAANRFHIDNERWNGVPFFVRVGKCIPELAKPRTG